MSLDESMCAQGVKFKGPDLATSNLKWTTPSHRRILRLLLPLGSSRKRPSQSVGTMFVDWEHENSQGRWRLDVWMAV